MDRSDLRARYRSEYLAGAEAACCEYAGYPKGFEAWPLNRRNAWWAGFNEGYALLHKEEFPCNFRAPEDRKAWQDYRKWEEKEIKEGRLKPNELTGRADALTAPRSKFEAQLKDAKNGRTPRSHKT